MFGVWLLVGAFCPKSEPSKLQWVFDSTPSTTTKNPASDRIKATKWKTSTAPYYLDAATPRNYGKPAKAQGLLPLNAEAGVWHSSEHPAPAEFPPEHPRWAPREKGPAKNEDKDAEHHRVCPDSTGAHSLQLWVSGCSTARATLSSSCLPLLVFPKRTRPLNDVVAHQRNINMRLLSHLQSNQPEAHFRPFL